VPSSPDRHGGLRNSPSAGIHLDRRISFSPVSSSEAIDTLHANRRGCCACQWQERSWMDFARTFGHAAGFA
jgi:hypothetical protein